jgi:hypothetical protein
MYVCFLTFSVRRYVSGYVQRVLADGVGAAAPVHPAAAHAAEEPVHRADQLPVQPLPQLGISRQPHQYEMILMVMMVMMMVMMMMMMMMMIIMMMMMMMVMMIMMMTVIMMVMMVM